MKAKEEGKWKLCRMRKKEVLCRQKLITVVVLVVGVRRVRRDRRRLEAMREEERISATDEVLYVDYEQFGG